MTETAFREKIFKRLESIEELPSLPVVILRLTETIQNVESSASDVARIMEEDPAIMARVLKIVNSAFYSNAYVNQPITNVKHAIVRLGYDSVRNIALTSCVFSVFREDHTQVFDRKEFWKHCICTGIVANVIYDFSTKKNLNIPRESVALAGLLHDMGKIILEQYFYDFFTSILEFGRDNKKALYLVEKSAFDISHAEIGAWLARKWKLSEDLLACIEFHHNPEAAPEKYRDMVGLVHIADYICNLKQLGQSGNTVPPLFNQGIWETLGLKLEMIEEILDRADEAAQKSEILLSLM